MKTLSSHRLAYWPLLFSLGTTMLLPMTRVFAQSCSATASPIAFGNVNVISGSSGYSANYNSSTSYTISCASGPIGILNILLGTFKASICLSIPGASGTTPRAMSSGANSLNYNLYADSANTTVWGSAGGSPGMPSTQNPVNLTCSSILGSCNVDSSPITIYGNVPSNINGSAVAGSTYMQSLAATLSYNYTTNGNTPTSCYPNGGTGGSTTMTVQATAAVINACTVTASPLSFGTNVGVLTGPIAVTATINAACTNGDSYTLTLNKGTTTGASLSNREMAGSGSAVVQYQLYTDSAHSTVWGDGSSGTSTSGGTGNGGSQSYTVYGLVPAQATPAPGSYSDTITVTVNY